MRQLVLGVVVLLVLLVGGCVDLEVGSPPEPPPGREPTLLPDESGSALGYLDVRGSLLVPWCAAVLVAPNVVLTAAHCVRDIVPSQVSFGLGRVTATGPEAGRYQVREIDLHPDRGQWQNNLAALYLEVRVRGVTPARLGDEAAPTGRLTSVTYDYVKHGEVGLRRVWAGQAQGDLDPITVLPTEGEPNCHVDSGAGVIGAGDNVLGFLSAGQREHQPTPGRGGVYDGVKGCYQSFKVAAVARNRPFIAEAMRRGAGAPVVP